MNRPLANDNLLYGFQQSCLNYPENIAFIEYEQEISYAQSMQMAVLLGNRLSQDFSGCQRVAVALGRGIDAAVAILAVLGVDACYIPLDLRNPVNRLAYIVDDADVQVVIGKGPCPEWLHNTNLWLDIEQKPSTPLNQNRPLVCTGDNLAAILYTSGSTGEPKGVAMSHAGMLNFAEWAANRFELNETSRLASLAPFFFDLSVFDLFSSLNRAASINFVPAQLAMAPAKLIQWMHDQRISVIYTVPSMLSFLSIKGGLHEQTLPDLRTILFAGEVFPIGPLKKLCAVLPDVEFFNLYGPTETNVCCFWPVDRSRLEKMETIPIGLPACNADLRIDIETHELWVKCRNNLAGYWRHKALQKVECKNDFFPTGDKVSVNDYAELCYHGRLDRMLKCSGYRVEPAEIESVVEQSSQVIQCAVLGITDSTAGQRIVAMLVLESGADLQSIVNNVKHSLPAYMHPGKYKILESMPQLSNGKTDYLRLQQQLEKDQG